MSFFFFKNLDDVIKCNPSKVVDEVKQRGVADKLEARVFFRGTSAGPNK